MVVYHVLVIDAHQSRGIIILHAVSKQFFDLFQLLAGQIDVVFFTRIVESGKIHNLLGIVLLSQCPENELPLIGQFITYLLLIVLKPNLGAIWRQSPVKWRLVFGILLSRKMFQSSLSLTRSSERAILPIFVEHGTEKCVLIIDA